MFLILLTSWQQIDKPKHEAHLEAYDGDWSIGYTTVAPYHRNLERNFPRCRHVGGLSTHLCSFASSCTGIVSWPTLQSETSTCVRLDLIADSSGTHHRAVHSVVALVHLRCLARCYCHRFKCKIRSRSPKLIFGFEFTGFHSFHVVEIVLVKLSWQLSTEPCTDGEGFNGPVHHGIFVV